MRRAIFAFNCRLKEKICVETSYSLVMGVEGTFALGEMLLGPEQALLLPAGTAVDLAAEDSAAPRVLLQALPRA